MSLRPRRQKTKVKHYAGYPRTFGGFEPNIEKNYVESEKIASARLRQAFHHVPFAVKRYISERDIEFDFYTREHAKFYPNEGEGEHKIKYIGGTAYKNEKKPKITLVIRGNRTDYYPSIDTIIHEAAHIGYVDVSDETKTKFNKKASTIAEDIYNFARTTLPPNSSLKRAQADLRDFINLLDDRQFWDVPEGHDEKLQRLIYKSVSRYKYSIREIAREIGYEEFAGRPRFSSYAFFALADFYAIEGMGRPQGAFHADPYEESFCHYVNIDNDFRDKIFEEMLENRLEKIAK